MTGRKPRPAMCSLLAVLTAVGLFGCDLFTPGPDFTPINLSDNEGRSESPRVACGPAGNTVVVWHDLTNKNQQDVWLREKPLGGEWLDAVNITDNPGDSRFADVCFDSTGVLHLVWQQNVSGNWRILYRRRGTDGVWAVVETVGGRSAVMPRMAIDNGLNPVVVFLDGMTGASALLCGRRDAWKWTVQQVAALHSPDAADVCPLAGDSLLAVWTTFEPESLYYSVCDEAGLWSAAKTVCDREVPSVKTPALWFDGAQAHLCYALRTTSGSEVAVQMFAGEWGRRNTSAVGAHPGTYDISGATGIAGPVVAATDRLSDVRVYAKDCVWRRLAVISDTVPVSALEYPAVAVRYDKRAVVVWQQRRLDDVYDIWCSEVKVK